MYRSSVASLDGLLPSAGTSVAVVEMLWFFGLRLASKCTRSSKETVEVLVLSYVRREAKVASSEFLILFDLHVPLS